MASSHGRASSFFAARRRDRQRPRRAAIGNSPVAQGTDSAWREAVPCALSRPHRNSQKLPLALPAAVGLGYGCRRGRLPTRCASLLLGRGALGGRALHRRALYLQAPACSKSVAGCCGNTVRATSAGEAPVEAQLQRKRQQSRRRSQRGRRTFCLTFTVLLKGPARAFSLCLVRFAVSSERSRSMRRSASLSDMAHGEQAAGSARTLSRWNFANLRKLCRFARLALRATAQRRPARAAADAAGIRLRGEALPPRAQLRTHAAALLCARRRTDFILAQHTAAAANHVLLAAQRQAGAARRRRRSASSSDCLGSAPRSRLTKAPLTCVREATRSPLCRPSCLRSGVATSAVAAP